MRNVFAVVAILLVAGMIAMLLFSDRRGHPIDDEPIADPSGKPAAPSEIKPTATPGTPGLSTGGRPRRRPMANPDGGVIRDQGAIVVRLVPPAGVDAKPETLAAARIDIDSLGASLPVYPLALLQEDGTWLYESVPVGRYRVKAVVAGFQVSSAVVEAKKDVDTPVDVELGAGGDVRWKATLLSGEPPAWIHVQVLDGRGQPVAPTVRTALGFTHLTVEQAPDLPAEASVVGLKPGPYTLKAAAPPFVPNATPETDEKAVVVKAGEVVAVEFSFRK